MRNFVRSPNSTPLDSFISVAEACQVNIDVSIGSLKMYPIVQWFFITVAVNKTSIFLLEKFSEWRLLF